MAESITVRERIERRVLAILGAISGIAVAERWSMHGNSQQSLSAVIVPGAEAAIDGGDGSGGITTQVLPIMVELLVAQTNKDPESSSFVFNRWLGKIQTALLADTRITDDDANTEKLANDVRYIGSEALTVTGNQSEFFLRAEFEIEYDTTRADPNTGPGVTERSV